MQQNHTAKQADRRNYFRIDDVTILYYRQIHEGESEELDQSRRLTVDRLMLKAKFESLTRELSPLSKSIAKGSPKLAQYLAAIDAKLNMLSEVVMDCAVDELHEKPQQVNISAGGLSFIAESPMVPGSLLELQIVLLLSNVGIYSKARVVFCKKESDDSEGNRDYRVAVEFVHMDEEFRDLISRHVLKREQEKLTSNQNMR